MEKITSGTFTIQRVANYGAALQTFALQKYLHEQGITNEIIDFKRKEKKVEAYTNRFGSFLGSMSYTVIEKLKEFRRWGLNVLAFKDLQLKKLNAKEKYFRNFEDSYLTFSEEFEEKELAKVNDKYNYFLVGSDQVWNHTFDFSIEAYFLDFIKDENVKIAISPSFGVTEVPKALNEKYKERFLKFKNLSVREKEGAFLIKKISGRDAEVLFDPVFIFNKAEWLNFLDLEKSKPNFSYVLCYTLGKETEKAMEVCREIRKKTGAKIVRLGRGKGDLKINDAIVEWNVGPVEFLRLLLHAEAVVTNSFHATAFSINFNRPFFSVLRSDNPRTSRLSNILHYLNLETKIILDNMEYDLNSLKCFGSEKQVLVDKERERLRSFIKTSFDLV